MAGEARMDDLFRGITWIEFKGHILHLRALSDFDLHAREEHALRISSKMRKAIQTPDSVENLMYLQWMEEASEDSLRYIILLNAQKGFWDEAFTTIEPRILPFPDNASDEEKDQVLRERAEELNRVGNERSDLVTKKQEALSRELENKPIEDLQKRARRAQISFQMRFARERALESYTIWAGIFKDPECKEHFVASVEEADQLEPDARRMIINEYYRQMQRLSELDLKYFLLMGAYTDSLPHSKAIETAAES